MQAIIEITDNLRKSIDKNLYTYGVFLDFAKAFDTVNQCQLKQHEDRLFHFQNIQLIYINIIEPVIKS